MRNNRFAAAALFLVVLGAACEREATGPADELSAAEVLALAPQLAAPGIAMVDGFALGMHAPPMGIGTRGPGPSSTEFTRTMPCPGGGQITMQGSAQVSFDRETRSMSSRFEATQTAQACVLNAHQTPVVMSGNPSVRITATRTVEQGRLVEAKTTQKGSVVYQRGDASRTCDIDLTSSVDATTHTVSITGSMCGSPVDRTHQWREPPHRGG